MCERVDRGSALWATGRLIQDPQRPATHVRIELSNESESEWSEEPVLTAISGIAVAAFDFDDTRVIIVTMDQGATTGTFQVRGKLTDGVTTCDVDRTFTVTIDGSGRVDIAKSEELSSSPDRHTSMNLVRCDGREVKVEG